jgi:transcriptional regulator with XRE-family HTH domain
VTADAERTRLRELRTDLGWTQQEMAERLATMAWMEHRERVGVNAGMVAKWERGAKDISPRYRELLCRLFGVTPDQLGLKNAPAVRGTRYRADDQSLVAMLDKAAGVLDQLGAAGTASAPHMLHAWKESVITLYCTVPKLDAGSADQVFFRAS